MNDPKIFALMKEEKIRKIQSKYPCLERVDLEAGFDGLNFNPEKALYSLISRISDRSVVSFYNKALGKEYEQSRD